MNIPAIPELKNDAVLDSNTTVVNQRARDLLCTITAKREQLERRQKTGQTTVGSTKSSTKPHTKADISSILTVKIQDALRDKRNRLRKHLRVVDDVVSCQDHQDNTQTTETSTATPGSSQHRAEFSPLTIRVQDSSKCDALSPLQQNVRSMAVFSAPGPPNVFCRSSKSFDDSNPQTSVSPLRKARSFDEDLLLQKLLVVAKTRCNDGDSNLQDVVSNESIVRTRKEGASSADGDVLGKTDRNKARQKTVRQSKRLSRRSRSFDTNRQLFRSPPIQKSMSLDRGVAHNKLNLPRGDRTQHLLTFDDVEVPPEISPIDPRPPAALTGKATISRRTGAKIAVDASNDDKIQKGFVLQTKEERAAYINELYHCSSKVHMRSDVSTPSDRRKDKADIDHGIIKARKEEKQKNLAAPLYAVGHNYDRPSSNGEELMKLSLKDNVDRREMLRRLQLDLNRPKPMAKMLEVARRAAIGETSDDSSTEEYFPFSDDSSCDYTTSTEVTGIESLSSAIEGKKRFVTFANPHSPKQERDKSITRNANIDPLRSTTSVPRTEISSTGRLEGIGMVHMTADDSLLSIPDDADQHCIANGGLFDIATKSGLDQRDQVPLKRLPRSSNTRPQIRLSTDYRCGTYGSHYDIALRSGYLLETEKTNLPPSKTKRKGTEPSKVIVSVAPTDPRKPYARGSLYDLALQSGLTKAMIRTRASFSFTVQRSSKGTRPCFVSPKYSDERCGACGSAYLAATCVEKKNQQMIKRPIHRGLYPIREIDME